MSVFLYKTNSQFSTFSRIISVYRSHTMIELRIVHTPPSHYTNRNCKLPYQCGGLYC